MKNKSPTISQRLDYIDFLQKRLNSENYKKNVSAEEYKKTEDKLKKEKMLVTMLGTKRQKKS